MTGLKLILGGLVELGWYVVVRGDWIGSWIMLLLMCKVGLHLLLLPLNSKEDSQMSRSLFMSHDKQWAEEEKMWAFLSGSAEPPKLLEIQQARFEAICNGWKRYLL